jgi:ribonuclease Z
MFEILFLGTSASAPSAKRGLSAAIVSHDEYRFLVDCGEGTQRQILQSGAGFKRLTRILLTHGHLDHILGLGGLMSTFLRWEAIDELEIFGGRSALDRVHDLLFGVVLRGKQPPMPLTLREIKPGIFFEAGDFTVTAFPVTHRGPDCLGYLFETKARRPFLAEKADELGCPVRSRTPRPGQREKSSPWPTVERSNRTMCWVPGKAAPNWSWSETPAAPMTSSNTAGMRMRW